MGERGSIMSAVAVEEIIVTILPRLERVNGAGENVSARCPFPDHEDKAASFSLNKRTGLWKCHGSCGRRGNAHQLARELGCLSGSRPRSASRATVDWGLDAAMEKYGAHVTSKAVVFRIKDHDGNRCRDHARLHSGEPRFQYWGEGRTYHAWAAWDLMPKWGRECGIAYIVEGDRDALTLAAHGYSGIGILGVDHFDHAIKDIAAPLKSMRIGALVLTPDNDAAGVAAVSDWAPKLEALGFVVGVRTLPETINGAPVKDTFDAYSADRAGFDDLMFELPVSWRAR
jgi:hypothetical protein